MSDERDRRLPTSYTAEDTKWLDAPALPPDEAFRRTGKPSPILEEILRRLDAGELTDEEASVEIVKAYQAAQRAKARELRGGGVDEPGGS
jgi:hypothetical protein